MPPHLPQRKKPQLQVGDAEISSAAKYAIRKGPAYFPDQDGDFNYESPFVQGFLKYRLFDQSLKTDKEKFEFFNISYGRMIQKGKEARNQIVQAIKGWHLSKFLFSVIIVYSILLTLYMTPENKLNPDYVPETDIENYRFMFQHHNRGNAVKNPNFFLDLFSEIGYLGTDYSKASFNKNVQLREKFLDEVDAYFIACTLGPGFWNFHNP